MSLLVLYQCTHAPPLNPAESPATPARTESFRSAVSTLNPQEAAS
jgi:hypothetical protein